MERIKRQQTDTTEDYSGNKKQKLQNQSKILCLFLINLFFSVDL
jgi:hypothetical protein